MTRREIIVCRDLSELSQSAARQFVGLAAAAIAARGRFSVALSGGSTPRALYSLLANPPFSTRIDWPSVHLFWGDERCVPPDHADSNFRMTKESLLSRISIPVANVHRLRGEDDPDIAAQAYEAELRHHFGSAAWPRFDLVLLGLGDDGHTASLFPQSSALTETQRWVATTYVEKLAAHRLTLTFTVLNHADQVIFLVAGGSKAEVLAAILSTTPVEFPAARVAPADGCVTWLVDRSAAEKLAKT